MWYRMLSLIITGKYVDYNIKTPKSTMSPSEHTCINDILFKIESRCTYQVWKMYFKRKRSYVFSFMFDSIVHVFLRNNASIWKILYLSPEVAFIIFCILEEFVSASMWVHTRVWGSTYIASNGSSLLSCRRYSWAEIGMKQWDAKNKISDNDFCGKYCRRHWFTVIFV